MTIDGNPFEGNTPDVENTRLGTKLNTKTREVVRWWQQNDLLERSLGTHAGAYELGVGESFSNMKHS